MAIEEFEPEQSPFRYVYADVTHRCQMGCSNCYLPNRDVPDMDIDALLKCISRFPRKTDIRLVGGEPTLIKNLVEVVSRIGAAGHRPILITNGLKLANVKLVRDLHAAGLRYLQLSMNGFDDDKVYLKTDMMKCAKEKIAAAENCDQEGISVAMSCILIRGLNEHLAPKFFELAKRMKSRPRLNFRNIGNIGRNMRAEVKNYSTEELLRLVSLAAGYSQEDIQWQKVADNQFRFLFGSAKLSKAIVVKVTDWSIYKETELDSKRRVRGRITKDFKVAPFFEHVIANEFGY